jgi:hypothetical protein
VRHQLALDLNVQSLVLFHDPIHEISNTFPDFSRRVVWIELIEHVTGQCFVVHHSSSGVGAGNQRSRASVNWLTISTG